jgi:hypothetical protein
MKDDPEFKRKRAEYGRKRYQANKERANAQSRKWAAENPKRTKEIYRLSRNRRLIQNILKNCRQRANKRGMEYSLDPESIVIPDRCPIFGWEFCMDGSDPDRSPSIDRIDSSKGYTHDNIQVLSRLANCMKWTATPEQLVAFARGILAMYDGRAT